MTKGWFVDYKNPDPYRTDRTVYLKREKAYEDASISIMKWTAEEIGEVKEDESLEHVLGRLEEIVDHLDAGHHEQAYDLWREYADENEPEEDVNIEEIDVVE